MKIFLTGADTFLGKSVINELVRREHNVVTLVDNEDIGRSIKARNVDYIVGNLIEGGQWCDSIQKVDSVISLTKPFRMGEKVSIDKLSEYSHRHTEMVTNLIKGAAGGTARSVTVTYSTQCFGDRKGKWASDADSIDPIGYCRTMTGSFEAIDRVGQDAELPIISLYPSLVYGAGGWFKMLVDSFLNGTAKVVSPGDNYLSLIHVDDAAAIYALAAEKLDKTDSFIVSDDRPVRQRVLMDFIADMLNKPIAPLVDSETYSKDFGVLASEAMASSTRVDGLKIMGVLGFAPKLRSYETGIPSTLESMGITPRKAELEEAA